MGDTTDYSDSWLMSKCQAIEEALGNLADPTLEMAEKTVMDLLPPSSKDARALAPFTGYYGINTAPGAFFSIDTYELYINYPLTQKITFPLSYTLIAINVSLDGTTSNSYPFDSSASFDGKSLIVPNVLKVSLAREYKDGQLATLSGTISGNPASGSTDFNPVGLPVFVGAYKDQKKTTGPNILIVNESSLTFDFGQGLQNIPVFWYMPAMYVVELMNAGMPYALMLGTGGKLGLACFVTNDGRYLYTIPA